MPGPRQGNRRRSPGPKAKPQRAKQAPPTNKQHVQKVEREAAPEPENPNGFEIVGKVHLSLQQLLLDVFKTALLTNHVAAESAPANPDAESGEAQLEDKNDELDMKSLIQTIKGLLYQRDFDSAFTEAGEDLLRAYALRWSASRSLGYAGLLKGVLCWMKEEEENTRGRSRIPSNKCTRVVCIGGGAGAEIVALAAAWRDLGHGEQSLEDGVAAVSLEDTQSKEEQKADVKSAAGPSLSVSAVDIADWSKIVDRLTRTITSAEVPFAQTTRYRSPLLPSNGDNFDVSFRRSDVLTIPEEDLREVFMGPASSTPFSSILVPIMFTLNELFSTSMPKTTGFLLRMTEILPAGAILLVVDSPGSYSTLKLGKGPDGEPQERNYPMKFLLDHTLLSVAKGKWERVYTEESRWWRRDDRRLKYEVGEGAGLEDMRFQMHVYRRL
ncbi:hypothetical protein PENANT_c023G05021 [Penicillium antarcticum]|uniref:25S rRNA (Uridine(2843)-N(3))-methyltransferase n=1 Tax=Penicillium antarcticum TaxID=416450 RepID=A0A1V6PYS2_9EURO|nr:uncharacterized protein N7508_006187 [Penicillium antarcticum]KAJ5301324.1 hypothetical protein N7508_006187 [Penicillium antarcticum]OQD82174.1 hypothetical protein PENANT_c023G05021 [Penicillium antarcticum]